MQVCGATRDPIPGKDKGWECDGGNLVVLIDKDGNPMTVQGTPIVVRASLRDQMDAVWQEVAPDVRPFDGGDHVHAVLEVRRP